MKIQFQKKRLDQPVAITMKDNRTGETLGVWQDRKINVISECNKVIARYSSRITLRQLYYQLVISNFIPNHDAVYKKLGGIVRDGRLAGLIDWDAIEDRVRVAKIPSDWENPKEAVKYLYHSYQIRRTRTQDIHLELWCEKDAISSILSPITSEYHVYLMVNRGYGGWSAFYDAYKRMFQALLDGKKVKILYLGDHDPSGLDMIRDIRDRMLLMLGNYDSFIHDNKDSEAHFKTIELDVFGRMNPTEYGSSLFDEYGGLKQCTIKRDKKKFFNYAMAYALDNFTVEHIGITKAQINEHNAPPNPAKFTDTRATAYVAVHGPQSWEVDAIPPDALESVVTRAIEASLDMEKWNAVKNQENKDKRVLLSSLGLSEDDI